MYITTACASAASERSTNGLFAVAKTITYRCIGSRRRWWVSSHITRFNKLFHRKDRHSPWGTAWHWNFVVGSNQIFGVHNDLQARHLTAFFGQTNDIFLVTNYNRHTVFFHSFHNSVNAQSSIHRDNGNGLGKRPNRRQHPVSASVFKDCDTTRFLVLFQVRNRGGWFHSMGSQSGSKFVGPGAHIRKRDPLHAVSKLFHLGRLPSQKRTAPHAVTRAKLLEGIYSELV